MPVSANDLRVGLELNGCTIDFGRSEQGDHAEAGAEEEREAGVRMLARAVIVGAFVLAGCIASPSTRRIHAKNISNASAFKATFDRDIRPGASFDEVLRYVKTHNLHFGPLGLTTPQDEPPPGGNGELEIEMFRGKSPDGYCGQESVGLEVFFTDNKLTGTRAGSWSLDCL